MRLLAENVKYVHEDEEKEEREEKEANKRKKGSEKKIPREYIRSSSLINHCYTLFPLNCANLLIC